MGNNCSNNLKQQSVLSVSQPRLVATTSQLFLQAAHQQRPKSDTDLFRNKTPTTTLHRSPLVLMRPAKGKETNSDTDASTQLLKRTTSIRRTGGYKARSASLRRQRSILRRRGNMKGKSRTTIRKTIELESELKMAQEQKELCVMAARGDLQSVEAFIDSGTDVNSADENQQTVLHHAAMHSRDEVINSLIDRGADVNATDLKGGFSALHWVVINADPQTGNTDHVSKSLRALVNRGCKVNGTDFNFATALHIATQKGNKTSIETLIRLGADPDKVDITGRNCYDMAKNQQIRDFMKRLQQTPKEDNHVYHILEVQPAQPPQSLGPRVQKRRSKPVSEHIYHILDSSPPPQRLTPSPPPQSSSTPPPPPPRRRRTLYSHYDFADTHIYHVLEAPPATNKPSSPVRRRKTITGRK